MATYTYTFTIPIGGPGGGVVATGYGAKPADEVAEPPRVPCSFCSEPAAPIATKRAWFICQAKECVEAAIAQTERIEAGLFDSPETRASALNWVRNRAQ